MKPCYIIPLVADDGLSPNGKATDSDSVIFKVRILVALLKELTGQFLFCYLEKVL